MIKDLATRRTVGRHCIQERRGGKYGQMTWANYGRSACRGDYEFYPKDYGVHGMWVILTPPAIEPPPQNEIGVFRGT